jgi:2-dehydro-3-deoxyphosphogluconate aldolase/(4S)-4-hydroxy-2-oxoglutarate aldolase
MNEILNRLERVGVVPVITIGNLDHALGVADALLEGGISVAEITFRTEIAAEVIARLHDQRPELFLGAGTVLNARQLTLAHAAGASFALAPGTDVSLLATASELGIPFYPGIMTPSDIQAALKAHTSVFKFFPAIPAGGLSVLRAILAPFAHLGIRTIPTGGLTLKDLPEWLREPCVLAVGGTWIASGEAIAAGDWKGISERSRTAAFAAAETLQKPRSLRVSRDPDDTQGRRYA